MNYFRSSSLKRSVQLDLAASNGRPKSAILPKDFSDLNFTHSVNRIALCTSDHMRIRFERDPRIRVPHLLFRDSRICGISTVLCSAEPIRRHRSCLNKGHRFVALASLPQHSGCPGKEELSHPPPKACTRRTAFTMRRPRMLTAVTSSERAALSAVVTSR
jgi:hypothetical protein